jgi:hypothetical protein
MGMNLVIIEGMSRDETNLYSRFTYDSLKLAMVKNKRVTETLFNGNLCDCICLFESGRPPSRPSGSFDEGFSVNRNCAYTSSRTHH